MTQKNNNFPRLALIMLLLLVGCTKVNYDYKALGFSDKEEMEEAHKKGYHSKQKLLEMTNQAVPQSAPANNALASASEPPPQTTAAEPQPEPQMPAIEEQVKEEQAPVVANSSCDSVQTCAEAMLSAAKTENLSQAMEAARRIDAMPKPERGNRKLARKLNKEGLDTFAQHKLEEAALILTSAREADPLDEEIVGNLVFAYTEARNYEKVEKLFYEGILINPRRANLWLPLAIVKQKQGKPSEALQAMWLSWQFSTDKEKLLGLIEKRIAEEPDESLKNMYISAKPWVLERKKPSF